MNSKKESDQAIKNNAKPKPKVHNQSNIESSKGGEDKDSLIDTSDEENLKVKWTVGCREIRFYEWFIYYG